MLRVEGGLHANCGWREVNPKAAICQVVLEMDSGKVSPNLGGFTQPRAQAQLFRPATNLGLTSHR